MISTRQLAFRYAGGPERGLGDIDVEPGGVLLLHGASGSKKSIGLVLAAGLLCPGEGSMTVAGQSINALRKVAGDAWRSLTTPSACLTASPMRPASSERSGMDSCA